MESWIRKLLACLALLSAIRGADGKWVHERIDVETSEFKYLTKFCFGVGTGKMSHRWSEALVDKGYTLVLYMDEIWNEVLEEKTCMNKLNRFDHLGRGQVTIPLSTAEGLPVLSDHVDQMEEFDLQRMTSWAEPREITQSLRPHYWYAVLVNCHGNATDHRRQPAHFDLEFINDGDVHFGADEFGLPTCYILCMLVMLVVGGWSAMQMKQQYRRTRNNTYPNSITGRFHPVVEVLNMAMMSLWAGMFFQVLHYACYAYNGIGLTLSGPFAFLSSILSEGTSIILTTLFIVISQGWTITSDKLPAFSTLIPIFGGTMAFEVIGVLLQVSYADSHDAYTSRAREGVTGFLLCLNQLGSYAWFVSGIKNSMAQDTKQMSSRRTFFKIFTIACSIWFLAEPLLVLLGTLLANYYRQRLLVGGSLILQTAASSMLAYLFLWPKSLYFRVSTMSQSELPFS